MSNATQSASSSDSLTLVSSFYGPGPTACWYLICLSCFISWTLHPRKRHSGAITSDLIALVTFPTVASVHLITQTRSWPSEPLADEKTLLQMRASLTASLTITENYRWLYVILLLPSIFPRMSRRLRLVELTGIFCVSSECYMYGALPLILNSDRARKSSIEKVRQIAIIIFIHLFFIGLLLVHRYLVNREMSRLITRLLGLEPKVDGLWLMAISSLVTGRPCLLSAFDNFLAVGPNTSVLLYTLSLFKSNGQKESNWRERRSFWDKFFPRTEATILDLDQAVALFTGMSVLGFSLYSAADAHYNIWWAEKKGRQNGARRLENASV